MSRADEREHAFLQFALEIGVLRFGEFTLKSGRVSPYFFNAGLFNSGAKLSRLAAFYAAALAELEPKPFMLFLFVDPLILRYHSMQWLEFEERFKRSHLLVI